jgi:hypothetical protein
MDRCGNLKTLPKGSSGLGGDQIRCYICQRIVRFLETNRDMILNLDRNALAHIIKLMQNKGGSRGKG